MFATARKLKSFIIGTDASTVTSDEVIANLKAASIPISSADCRMCPNPCDEGHEEYPKKFDADMETYMLGSVKPYRRQVIISTGKTDWAKEVTEVPDTLAAYLLETQPEKKRSPSPPKLESTDIPAQPKPIDGIYRSSDSTRLAILNGSHTTLSAEEALETVLIFPDYKVVAEVPRSLDGAKALWASALDMSGQPTEEASFKTWVLPYSCVILLCSHKKRDNRCSIAAPKLEHAFIQSLEHHKWEVHTQLEGLPCTAGPSLETIARTQEERAEHVTRQLRDLHSLHKALILKNSHIGGHKFAGNCIIYTPQGSGVWYGRVTTHEVESIVQNTIIGGEVLAPLLRGGLNLSKPGCAKLNDW